MHAPRDATVYLVDDDASVREALSWLLRTRRVASDSFDSAELFLQELPNLTNHAQSESATSIRMKYPSCAVLDVRMPGGMSGLELFEQLLKLELTRTLPIIFLTGHADVPTAVDAVKRGAFDFIEKPLTNNLLVDRIAAALQQSEYAITHLKACESLQQKMTDLTERERAVMQLVVEGVPNKLVANQLDISVRTVEVHRARIFEKMGVKSAVELANVIRLS